MKKLLLIAGLLLLGVSAFAGKYEDELTERMKVEGVRAFLINDSVNLVDEWEK